MVSQLPETNRPLVVFVSAQRQHTLRAFELGAVDFLLVPLKPARVRQVVARLRERLQERSRPSGAAAVAAPVYLKRVIVRLTEHQLIIPTIDIDWMESASNYIVLHVGGATHVLRDTLSSLEKRLTPVQFLRVGRFAIVNLDRVRKMKLTFTGDHLIVMADGTEIPITGGVRELQARLEHSG